MFLENSLQSTCCDLLCCGRRTAEEREREKGYLFIIMDSVLGSHNCMIHGDYCVLPFYECIYVFVW